MRTLFLATLAFASLATTARALDVRFYPGERVYA